MDRRSFLPGLLSAGAMLAGLPLTTRSAAQSAARVPAPEFAGIDAWLNSPTPLTIAGLRGKVVLVDFWTYSCINCRRTVPYLNRWQAEYGPHGLQVIGIHTPEFGFERVRHNVEDAVREFGIRYPVGQDNQFQTWRAWSNRAWPAFYLLDQDGRIVLLREGEGYAREMEGAIRALLGLSTSGPVGRPGDDPDLSRVRSPEIYFGAQHPTPQDRAQSPRRGEAAYAFTGEGPRLNQYQLEGKWNREEEALVLRSARGGLRLRFSAAKLHLVAAAPQGGKLRVSVDGGAAQEIELNRPTLYTLLDGTAYGEHQLLVEAEMPGLSLFSATFG
ncbi:thioredoxin family protein [Belnapia sp. T18]|uniref:Thioredoxin family protein n=1 Tax=Belnapia arida TaxID=2804533 RepID=A0ABS1UD13_9PROT|nr:thioredoxin family protein [Belnapia arida]MBL6082581.1 thioredoxin family protein [Belnapia arida]